MSILLIHQKSCPMKLFKLVMNILNVSLKICQEIHGFSKVFCEKGSKMI